MQERTHEVYPLLREFRQFYAEIVNLRRILKGSVLPEPATRGGGPRFKQALAAAVEPTDPEAGVTETALTGPTDEDVTIRVWQHVANYLDEKMFELKYAGNALFRDRFEELIYIMSAFADETFLCMVDWSGIDYWRDHLMELRYFRSQISGQMIFRRIDDLLKRQDYGDDELCAIYLMVLSLGFKGSLARNPSLIDDYRGKLYDLLLLINPEMRRESLHLFPEAYRHTVTEGAPVRLAEPRTWWIAVGAVVASWLVVSTAGWMVLTRSTRADLKIVNDTLNGVVASKTVNALSRRYQPMEFETTEDGFKLAVDSRPTSNGSQTQPLLIAVYGENGRSAGTEEEVRTSLLRGVLSTPGTDANLASYSRAVLDVRQVSVVPSGLRLRQGTLLFTVDLPAVADRSSAQFNLYFPQEPSASGVNIGSLVAYKPVGLAGEEQ